MTQPSRTRTAGRTRRRWRTTAAAMLTAALTAATLAGCGSGGGDAGPKLGLDEPLPQSVPQDTVLRIGDPTTQRALELSGEIDKLPFKVEWANISGGPQTLEAFRADALDVGAVADIPPLFATWTGTDVKIVAAQFHKDPVDHPIYQLGIAPGVDVKDVEDLARQVDRLQPRTGTGRTRAPGAQGGGPDQGRRRPGRDAQRRGRLRRRARQQAGRRRAARRCAAQDLPGQVRQGRWHRDPARAARRPVGPLRPDDGARGRDQGGGAARVREVLGARPGLDDEHPDEWIKGYYEETEGLSEDDGQYLVDQAGELDIPARGPT